MGISPTEVLAMPLHDYQAALFHFARAQGSDDDDPTPLGDGEYDDMVNALSSAGLH